MLEIVTLINLKIKIKINVMIVMEAVQNVTIQEMIIVMIVMIIKYSIATNA